MTLLAIEVKLKSCPFCCTTAQLHVSSGAWAKDMFWVKCDNLQCRATLVSVESQDEAARNWNRRD